MKMQAVILAGGLGTRLRPITEKIPKPLVSVAGKPFLFWQLQYLKTFHIRNVLILCSYLGSMIEEEFGTGDELGLKLSYSFEPEPLGTGGALSLAKNSLEDEFFLFNGDSFLWAPLTDMEEFWRSGRWDALVSCFPSENSVVPGNLDLEESTVMAYKKGGDYRFVDSGVYILKKESIRDIPNKHQLEELWPPLIERKTLGAFLVNERFYDIGTVERLKKFEEKIGDYFPNAI